MLNRILFEAAPAAGNGNTPAVETPAVAPVVPPAAAAVIAGTKTEAEIKLEADLKSEQDSHARTAEEKKAREIRISELEDELRRLRELQSDRPRPSKKGIMQKFFDGEPQD